MMLGPGDRIGDWIVEARLGAGGMGTVFRCRNALADRIRAAVKVLHPDDPEGFRERFVREVEALEQLEHPGIVRVKGWGEDERGWLWLAMDLVEGEDLGARLKRGPLGVEEAVAVFRTLAGGLAHAHSRSVFHRDIKPANILLQDGGGAKLVDFGIAMQADRTRLSMAGVVAGTPAYLAPEVFGGTPQAQRLDVYALGQVLYEALTGRSAFPEPDGMTTTARIAHVAGSKLRMEPLDPGDAFPEPLRRLVRLATHPDPNQRVQDMETFCGALEGGLLEERAASATLEFDLDAVVERHEPAAPEPAQPRPIAPPPATGTPPAWGLLVVGLAVAGLLLGVSVAAVALTRRAPAPLDTTVVITGITDTTPVRVRMNGERVETRSGTRFSAQVPGDGAVTVEVVSGEHCDLDAWSGLCGVCCGCATAEVPRGGQQSVAAPPPDPRREVQVRPTREDGTPWRAWLDDVEITADDGVASVPPGAHTVRLERGACPAGCGPACPPGCASVEQVVEVPCGSGPLQVRLDLAEPEPAPAPAIRTPRAAYPRLRGAKVRILHMSAELEVAHRAADALRAQGAEVEVMVLTHEHSSSFGRTLYWAEDREAGAHDVQKVLERIGYAAVQPRVKSGSSDGLDYVVWLKGP
ncbi:MAG: serine/threonine protein kinase [Alphaproteobacteria bacterium]|nr:serine/threonine protein kinase [Alphaproteobacteria bacterium]